MTTITKRCLRPRFLKIIIIIIIMIIIMIIIIIIIIMIKADAP
jgi:hypothetical protein